MARKIDYIEKIDKNIGYRIYELRLILGMSRQELSDKIGVTHQQLQKYEKGVNRISAGRLFVIAKVLGKSIEYFYNNIDPTYSSQNIIETTSQRKCMEVSRNFMRIKNEEYQNAVNFLVRKLANSDIEENTETSTSS